MPTKGNKPTGKVYQSGVRGLRLRTIHFISAIIPSLCVKTPAPTYNKRNQPKKEHYGITDTVPDLPDTPSPSTLRELPTLQVFSASGSAHNMEDIEVDCCGFYSEAARLRQIVPTHAAIPHRCLLGA